MHDCQRYSHATSQTAISANITQSGRIRVYCSWFWVVLGRFGWFRVLVIRVRGSLVIYNIRRFFFSFHGVHSLCA